MIVSYTRSKTWEKRQKSGAVSLGDDELQKGGQSTTLSLRTHGQSAHSEGNQKKNQDDESPEVSDKDDAQPRVHPQKTPQAKDILGRTARRGGGYGSGDDENETSLPRGSKDLLSISPPATQQHSDPNTSTHSGRRDTADSKSSRTTKRGGKYEDDRPKEARTGRKYGH
jgi:hypothetical protein